MTRLSHIPQALKQAFVDGQKPDKFYGSAQNLRQSRSRSVVVRAQQEMAKQALKRLGL